MYSPEGYESVRSLYLRFRKIADAAFPKTVLPGASEEERAKSQAADAWNSFAESVTALLNFLDQCKQIYICTPTGVCLAVDPLVLRRQAARENIGFAGMWAIDHETWCINLGRARRWLATSESRLKEARLFLRVRQRNGLDTQEAEDRLNRLWLANGVVTALVGTFEQFSGSSLCVSADDSPSDQDVRNLILTGSLFDRQVSVGRPSQREQVLRAYLELFPDGHSGTPWKEVQAAIQNECGVYPSVDTIKRAIGLRN